MAAGELRIPSIEQHRPEAPLGPEAAFAWSAYHDLACDRQVGMGGALGIPWTAAQAYFDEAGMRDKAEREFTWRLLVRLSTVEAEIASAKMNEATNKPPSEPTRRKRAPHG